MTVSCLQMLKSACVLAGRVVLREGRLSVLALVNYEPLAVLHVLVQVTVQEPHTRVIRVNDLVTLGVSHIGPSQINMLPPAAPSSTASMPAARVRVGVGGDPLMSGGMSENACFDDDCCGGGG